MVRQRHEMQSFQLPDAAMYSVSAATSLSRTLQGSSQVHRDGRVP